jgi:hypothetical protein
MYQGKKKESQAEEEAAKAPKSVIPESAYAALSEASNLAKGRSSGAARAEQSLGEAAATAAYRAERGATSGQQLQAAVSGAHATEQKGVRAIQQAEEQDTTRRKSVYINQLYKMAGLEQQTDDSNKQNTWNITQGVRAAGKQQFSSGLQSAVATGMIAAGDSEIGFKDTKIPKLGEDGNPIIDKFGEPVMEKAFGVFSPEDTTVTTNGTASGTQEIPATMGDKMADAMQPIVETPVPSIETANTGSLSTPPIADQTIADVSFTAETDIDYQNYLLTAGSQPLEYNEWLTQK